MPNVSYETRTWDNKCQYYPQRLAGGSSKHSLVHKLKHGNSPEYFNSYVCELRKAHTYKIRFSSSGPLAAPEINSESGKRMFKYKSIKLWNRLPTQVRNIEQYMQLKKCANVSNNLWMFLCIL